MGETWIPRGRPVTIIIWTALAAYAAAIVGAVLSTINHREENRKIMEAIALLRAKVSELEATISAEHAQVMNAVDELNETIAGLREQIATMPQLGDADAAALVEIAERLTAATANVQGIYSAPAPEPQPDPEPSGEPI